MIVGNFGWKKRLRDIVQQIRSSADTNEYSLSKIIHLVDAPQTSALVTELTNLIEKGEITAVYRLRSPYTQAGISEYKSLSDIPTTAYDETSDRYFEPNISSDIEIIYK